MFVSESRAQEKNTSRISNLSDHYENIKDLVVGTSSPTTDLPPIYKQSSQNITGGALLLH